jgi:hypothetical protein
MDRSLLMLLPVATLVGCSAPASCIPGSDVPPTEFAHLMDGPAFTPAHDTPRMIDRKGFAARVRELVALDDVSPERLEDAHIHVLVSPAGTVLSTRVARSSGSGLLDALLVADLRETQYTRPNLRYGDEMARERPVPYWHSEVIELGGAGRGEEGQ